MKKHGLAISTVLLALGTLIAHQPATAQRDYPIGFDATQDYTRTDRHLDAVSIQKKDGSSTTLSIPTPRKVYTSLLDKAFTARAGEALKVSFGYTGTWMNGYVYIDRGNDGAFDIELNNDGTPNAESDLMAFSNYEGINSMGESSGNGNVLNPPAFKVPAELKPGYYRMRFKVDWSSIDPAGRMDEENGILRNGGGLLDVRLNVHGDYCTATARANHGSILTSDGKTLDGAQLPFGQALTLMIQPNEGYTCDGVRIRHGYNLQGDSLLHGTPQYVDHVYPAFLIRNNQLTIPAEMMDGDVLIEALFVEQKSNSSSSSDYALNFEKDLNANTANTLKSMRWATTNGKTKNITLTNESNTIYRSMLDKQASIVPGESMTVTVNVDGTTPHLYLYVDLNQDGRFEERIDSNGRPTLSSELLSYTYYNGCNSKGEKVDDANNTGKNLPAFTIPAELPTGIYRARLKLDHNNIDPAGAWDESTGATIQQHGGYIIDLLLNVHNQQHRLELFTTNGNIYDGNSEALPTQITPFERLTLRPTPVANGYTAETIRVRHGHHFDGPQYVHGNRQWSEYSVPATRTLSIPTDSVNGDIAISVDFEAGNDAEYLLVFSDEFNTTEREQPDGNKWMRCQRYGSTWNRWLSNSEEVIYLEDGQLVARAIPNPDQKTDPVPMITGGIKTMGKFGFTYGKVECRALNNPWIGNFPAIWMMPEDQSAGWPDCGEIDIWEVIDAQATSFHTIHSNWTYDLGHKNEPQSSFSTGIRLDRYHTYGLEWDESSLKWYVDGVHVGTYRKSTDDSHLAQGQWPFDKHFHLILNQSVGNGSWAANADVTHTYETRFDWIRVYQKRGQQNTYGTVDIAQPSATPNFDMEVEDGRIHVWASQPLTLHIADLGGRIVHQQTVQGCAQVALQKGIYIVNGQKVMVP